jgi:hypothetical protein
MTAREIIQKVKELDLPEGSYIVFGSCPLAAVGIRESSDVDLFISEDLWQHLTDDGWQQVEKEGDDKPLEHTVFDAHTNWDFGNYNPTLGELLETAFVIDGVPFASLDEVRKWKSASGRPKDLKDLEMIDEYLSRQG